jgi:hypothetical protein
MLISKIIVCHSDGEDLHCGNPWKAFFFLIFENKKRRVKRRGVNKFDFLFEGGAKIVFQCEGCNHQLSRVANSGN